MFDIGWSELVIVAVIALIAIGPKELPGVLRALGYWMGKVRRMANDFQDQFKEAMREAEVDDLKKQVDDLNTAASDITSYNPIDDLSKDFESALEDKPSSDKPAETSTDSAAAGSETVVADERPDPVESEKTATTAEPSSAPDEDKKDLASAASGKTAGAGGRPA